MFSVLILGMDDKEYRHGTFDTLAEAKAEAAKWPSIFVATIVPSSRPAFLTRPLDGRK